MKIVHIITRLIIGKTRLQKVSMRFWPLTRSKYLTFIVHGIFLLRSKHDVCKIG